MPLNVARSVLQQQGPPGLSLTLLTDPRTLARGWQRLGRAPVVLTRAVVSQLL